MLKHRQSFITIMLVAIFVLTACQQAAPTFSPEEIEAAVQQTLAALPTATATPTPTRTPTPTITPTPVIVQYGPTNFPDNVNPLTGLEVSNPALLDRRPMMIKVSNFPREGRPHAGLSLPISFLIITPVRVPIDSSRSITGRMPRRLVL